MRVVVPREQEMEGYYFSLHKFTYNPLNLEPCVYIYYLCIYVYTVSIHEKIYFRNLKKKPFLKVKRLPFEVLFLFYRLQLIVKNKMQQRNFI